MLQKIVFLGVVMTILSCHSNSCPADADAFLNDYHLLLKDVSRLERYISTKEWQPYDQRFEHLILECYPAIKDDLSDSLDRAVWLDAITFAMTRHQYDAQKIIQDTTDQTLITIRNQMKVLWDNPYSAFEEIFRRQTGQDFQEVLKETKADSTGQE